MSITAYIFWCAAAFIFYVYAGYPLWLYALSQLRPRPHRCEWILPNLSIVLAVHNGAPLLRQKIHNLLSLDYPRDRIEIIVVSDGSTDATNTILTELCDPLITSICCAEHQGKAAALNAGIQKATGDILLFVDIRPWIEHGALKQLVSNFADPAVGCAAGELILCADEHDPGAQAVGGLYWRYEQWIRTCEAKIDSPLGVYGGFYAVRRSLARMLPEGTILDDMLQPLHVIRQGYRSVVDTQARVYDVWPRKLGQEFRRKVRTLAGNFQLLELAPWLLSGENRLRFQLISHKLLRLLVPAALVATLASSAALTAGSHFYSAVFAAQIVFYALAGVDTAVRLPLLRWIAAPSRAFCTLNAAVIVGFYHFLFAPPPLWKIWTASTPVSTGPAESRQ